MPPRRLNPASSSLSVEEGSLHFRESAIDGVVANATRFFRIPKVFRALRERILPEYRAAKTRRPFRVWSAACSSGEEPYSLAMVLLHLAEKEESDLPLRIAATDINETMIEKAKAGIYSVHPNAIKEYGAYFRRYGTLDGQVFTAGEEIRSAIRFRTFDLRHSPRQHRFRLIVCANVFQYYGAEARLHYLRNFIAACERPGYIHVDNIRPESLAPLGCEHLPEYGLLRVG